MTEQPPPLPPGFPIPPPPPPDPPARRRKRKKKSSRSSPTRSRKPRSRRSKKEKKDRSARGSPKEPGCHSCLKKSHVALEDKKEEEKPLKSFSVQLYVRFLLAGVNLEANVEGTQFFELSDGSDQADGEWPVVKEPIRRSLSLPNRVTRRCPDCLSSRKTVATMWRRSYLSSMRL